MTGSHRHESKILAALLHETVLVANYSSIAHVAVAVSIGFFFWDSASKAYLVGLIAAMSLINAVTLVLALRFKDAFHSADTLVIRRGRLLAIGLALGVGLSWSLMPYMLFKDADMGHQLIVISTAAGLVSDAFCVGPILAVSMALVLPIVTGSAVALCVLRPPYYGSISLLLLIYTAFVLASQVRLARAARERIRDRLLVNEQGQTIALLLNDFEEGASDWLWETDERGLLRHAPARMAQALGRAIDEIQGIDLNAILALHARPDDDVAATGTIADAMAEREPFHATIALRTGLGERWWTLNGKPTFDERGAFAGYRGVGSDVTTNQEAERRIAYLASHDVLTGLYNRAAFQDAVKVACANASARTVALLFLDLDGFKSVNDRSGHGAGDALLRSVADRLREVATAGARVCRLGGDEFGVLLKCGDGRDAEATATRLVRRLAEPFRVGHEIVTIGTSIGIAFTPQDSLDADELLARADLALYCAKEAGKGCWRRFDLTLDEKLARRRLLDREMRQALQAGDLELHYQPQVRLCDNNVEGYEALLRWHRDGEGWVSPAEVVPIAEATGFIVEIGRWALRTACSEALSWGGRRVAVNISSIHFGRSDFVADVEAALAETGLGRGLLEIEITESILLNRNSDVIGNLARLRALGVRIALDDFGTGYSSLSYLTRFSFDTIKIDRSFVRDLDDHPESVAVVEAITLMARALAMDVVAEGVETLRQLELVRAKRCGSVQGFLYGTALPSSMVRGALPRPVDVRAVRDVADVIALQRADGSRERKIA